jgi:aminoglycoside phosphotransferase (APT) family kinase protein
LADAIEVQAGLGRRHPSLPDRSRRVVDVTAPDGPTVERCRAFSPTSRGLVDGLLAAYEHRRRLPTDDLVHGDLCSDNVLVDAVGGLTIIDTQSIARGTRAMDLATVAVHSVLWEQGDDTCARFLARTTDVTGEATTRICAAYRVLVALDFALHHYAGYVDHLAGRARIVMELLGA